VLESGSAEGFLRDLLAIELESHGFKLTREFPTKSYKVDLVLHWNGTTYIEAKQLHLKDGAQFVKNVVSDVKRHARYRCLGVIYVVDETGSRFEMKRPSFGGANRNAKRGVREVMKALQANFDRVYPDTEKQACVRRFSGAGRLDLYAFVVENVR
jgi:hypothetical protein